ncbi:hypothetical protein OAE80_03360 [Planctomycetaceae bacterium]|nr:hypothetical protein [Planctomycetaceae bacterium]
MRPVSVNSLAANFHFYRELLATIKKLPMFSGRFLDKSEFRNSNL